MIKKVNILVTGCGGDIGQSIGKILNQSEYVNNLYGCDISGKNAAKFIYANFFIGFRYSDPGYLKNLESIVKEKKIDLVIPVSEPELRFFSKEHLLNKIGSAAMVTASDHALDIGFDKLKTASFLKKEHLPFPITHSLEFVNLSEEFPVIIKSRSGSGSSSVHIVKDAEEFQFFKKRNPDFIVQEFLDGENGEYTCGVFRSSKGITRSIILKRELTGGYSGYGEVIANKEIDHILIEIANKLNLVGSINVQLRITKKGPVVFEINPRFSSTVLFRHMFGFKDVEWSIEDKMDFNLSDYTSNSVGKEFFKGFNEYIQ